MSSPARHSSSRLLARRNFLVTAGTSLAAMSQVDVHADPPKEFRALRFTPPGNIELANTKGMLDVNSGTFTVEAWVQLPEVKPSAIQHIAGDMCPRGGWSLTGEPTRAKDGTWAPWFRMSYGLGQAGGSGSSFTALIWHHLAVVKLPLKSRIWIDGKLSASSGNSDRYVPSPLNISLGGIFGGDIRAFRISSAARYLKSFEPDEQWEKDDDTLVLLDILRGDGKVVSDLSGKKHHGQINKGVQWIGKKP